MSNGSQQSRTAILHMHMSEFWSGDLGLTLVSISLMVLIFVIFPLRQTGLSGRYLFDLMMVTLMFSGPLLVSQSRIVTILPVAMGVIRAVVLWPSRSYPSPCLRHPGSFFSIIILLLYV